jgi:hypothetical protein
MTSPHALETEFDPRVAVAPRLIEAGTAKLAPAKNYIFDAMSVFILGTGAIEVWRTLRFISHAVSDANTTKMILDWLKGLPG